MTRPTPRVFTARITARDEDSHAPESPGAVDADIYRGPHMIGSCTLIPCPADGLLAEWGDSIDCWADYDLQAAMGLDSIPVWEITSAVRAAAGREG